MRLEFDSQAAAIDHQCSGTVGGDKLIAFGCVPKTIFIMTPITQKLQEMERAPEVKRCEMSVEWVGSLVQLQKQGNL